MKLRCLIIGGALAVTSVIAALAGVVMRYTVYPAEPEVIAVAVPFRALKEVCMDAFELE